MKVLEYFFLLIRDPNILNRICYHTCSLCLSQTVCIGHIESVSVIDSLYLSQTVSVCRMVSVLFEFVHHHSANESQLMDPPPNHLQINNVFTSLLFNVFQHTPTILWYHFCLIVKLAIHFFINLQKFWYFCNCLPFSICCIHCH